MNICPKTKMDCHNPECGKTPNHELHCQFSQQPTEKTREGAMQCLRNWVLNDESKKQLFTDKEITFIINKLAESGYIQSDSVDAEEALQESFKKEWGNPPFNEKEAAHLAMRHMFRAGFLAGSKVKPVNEYKIIQLYKKSNNPNIQPMEYVVCFQNNKEAQERWNMTITKDQYETLLSHGNWKQIASIFDECYLPKSPR